MMPTVATTGRKLRRIRREAGLTQTDLSEKSGVAQSTIAHIENEDTTPYPTTLRKLAKTLEVRIADLLEDEED